MKAANIMAVFIPGCQPTKPQPTPTPHYANGRPGIIWREGCRRQLRRPLRHGPLRYGAFPDASPPLLPPSPPLPPFRCPPPPDFQGLESNWRPAGRVFIAAAGLAFVVALAITLTLALPQSDANAGDAPPPNQQADAPQQSGENNGNDGNNPGNGNGGNYPGDGGDGEDGADPPSPPQGGGAQAAGAMAQAQAQSVFLNVSKVTKNTATLTIAGHSTAWYYKANAAPDNSCKGPVTAGTKTKNLTGLSGNTTYTYKAYSVSGCATANLLAEATAFTTGPWLSVGSIGETTATLTITGHTGDWYYKANAAPHKHLPNQGRRRHDYQGPDRALRRHALHLRSVQRQYL